MEQNKQPVEEIEVKNEEMNEALLEETSTDPIDRPNTPTIIDADPKHDQLSLKLADGFEINLASIRHDVFQLANITVQLHKKFIKKVKKNGGSYCG